MDILAEKRLLKTADYMSLGDLARLRTKRYAQAAHLRLTRGEQEASAYKWLAHLCEKAILRKGLL